jgi:hypothetical protein
MTQNNYVNKVLKTALPFVLAAVACVPEREERPLEGWAGTVQNCAATHSGIRDTVAFLARRWLSEEDKNVQSAYSEVQVKRVWVNRFQISRSDLRKDYLREYPGGSSDPNYIGYDSIPLADVIFIDEACRFVEPKYVANIDFSGADVANAYFENDPIRKNDRGVPDTIRLARLQYVVRTERMNPLPKTP